MNKPSFYFPRVLLCLRLSALASALLLSACAHVPPESASTVPAGIPETLDNSLLSAKQGWPGSQWWEQYRDEQLNGLIQVALSESPSLQIAATRVRQAQAQLAASRAEQDIGGALNASANRQRYSGTGLFPPPIGGNYYTEETVQAQISYDLDWWGKHRAQFAAALGEVRAREAESAVAERNLIAAIVQTYFGLQADMAHQAQLKTLMTLTEAVREQQTRRLKQGLGTTEELRQSELQLAQWRSQDAALNAARLRHKEALQALAGTGHLSEIQPLPLPAAQNQLPDRLGMELLARRPDLQAASWRIRAAMSRVEWSQAAYYPDINLIAAVGLDSIAVGDLINAASRTVYLAPTLSLPLFEQKKLDAGLGKARAERDQALAEYRQAVINVVRDVAQAVVDVNAAEAQIQEQQAMLNTSEASLHSAREKLQHGLASRQDCLLAELALERQRDALLNARLQSLSAAITLDSALGGGYRHAGENSQ